MRHKIGFLVTLLCLTSSARGAILCSWALMMEQNPTGNGIELLKQNSTYFPLTDMAGYITRDGETVLMTLERMELVYDAEIDEFVFQSTLAFPAGTAAPVQWKQSHPDRVSGLRARGISSVYALPPVFLNSAKNGTGKLETWTPAPEGVQTVLVDYELMTLPALTVRGRLYENVRRISYTEPIITTRFENYEPHFIRTTTSHLVRYYAPGAGEIRRNVVMSFTDNRISDGIELQHSAHTTITDFEPIKPGSYADGLFAEHLTTITLQRTPDAFLNLLRSLDEFKELTALQSNAIKLLAETARTLGRSKFLGATAAAEFRDYLKSQGLSEAQLEIAIARAAAFYS